MISSNYNSVNSVLCEHVSASDSGESEAQEKPGNHVPLPRVHALLRRALKVCLHAMCLWFDKRITRFPYVPPIGEYYIII